MKKLIGLILGLMVANCLAAIELHVFVSFSMPEETLVALSRKASLIDGSIELKGLVNDSFKDTAKAIYSVSKKSAWGMNINPEGFSFFGVSAVPCFVLAEVGIDREIKRFDKVYGNVHLEDALEEIAKKGELSQDAHDLLNKLRGRNA